MFGLRKIAFAFLATLALAVYGCADMVAESGGKSSSIGNAEGTPCVSYKDRPKVLETCIRVFHEAVVNKARVAAGGSQKHDPCEEFSFYAPAFEVCAGELRKRIFTEAEAVGAGGFIIPQKVRLYPSRYSE